MTDETYRGPTLEERRAIRHQYMIAQYRQEVERRGVTGLAKTDEEILLEMGVPADQIKSTRPSS